MLGNLRVGTRLFILVFLMALFMIVIGSIGLYSMSTTIHSLNSVYEDRTVPLADLGKVNSLVNGMPAKSCGLCNTTLLMIFPNSTTTRLPTTSSVSRATSPSPPKPGINTRPPISPLRKSYLPKPMNRNARSG